MKYIRAMMTAKIMLRSIISPPGMPIMGKSILPAIEEIMIMAPNIIFLLAKEA